ncbi:IclR family transcriptional regulator [Mesorhizobium sp. J18]|uniref:IclR family transcriptional regulator n=1 Tax=Mesorhizobium sp. J18 TaxID=935263 RepID=UPI001198D26D|nr:IclR family transcriptional regulator [Mesorhizobium sp. J18]TWG95519.1 IclR family transcriptional regulator [Mesorhizobium sp. J18]
MQRSIFRAELGERPIEGHEDDPLFVQSVARAMQVLSAFHRSEKPLTLAEISAGCGIGKSAVQRVVHTLRIMGYIERDQDDRGYVPGIRILDHALDYLRLDPLIERATPVLLELRRAARERVDLSLFDDLRMVYAARLQSKRENFFATLVGHSVPVFCTSGGRAVLAQLPDAEVEDIIARSDRRPFTAKTITEPAGIWTKIREAREIGYAFTIEEVLVGEVAVGVAVRGPDGRPRGAIHLAGSLAEWTAEEFCQRFAPLANEAARAINRF